MPRLLTAARTDGVRLIVTSGNRSDAEQGELYKRHPYPSGSRPPGKSLHRVLGRVRSVTRGRYRAALRATDAAGNRSKPRRVSFRVVRR